MGSRSVLGIALGWLLWLLDLVFSGVEGLARRWARYIHILAYSRCSFVR